MTKQYCEVIFEYSADVHCCIENIMFYNNLKLYDKRNANMRFVVYIIGCNSFFVSLFIS